MHVCGPVVCFVNGTCASRLGKTLSLKYSQRNDLPGVSARTTKSSHVAFGSTVWPS